MTEQTTGRPPRRQLRRAGSRREVTHKVKVSAEVEARLVERAGARGITVSRLLVESALAGGAEAAAARAELASEMFSLMRVIGRIGLNINQLARVANATGSVPPETRHALDAMGRASDRLTALLDGDRS